MVHLKLQSFLMNKSHRQGNNKADNSAARVTPLNTAVTAPRAMRLGGNSGERGNSTAGSRNALSFERGAASTGKADARQPSGKVPVSSYGAYLASRQDQTPALAASVSQAHKRANHSGTKPSDAPTTIPDPTRPSNRFSSKHAPIPARSGAETRRAASSERMHRETKRNQESISRMREAALQMIADIFSPTEYRELAQFFNGRNEGLMAAIKGDAQIVSEGLRVGQEAVEEAMAVSKAERYAYQKRKEQIRKEAEHLTKVYQTTVAPFQMLMSQGGKR
ncbi:hypothetical protein FGO68_gene11301 [Halteria grandinella]|uniref:Uncharacterized protein n=1 Tax=Halteria grandinella TaxID=5974 RepID=A0A8J8SZG8_HALGN|nr:hypothetical protein FGO68_gene11301 [Halteria grandinella]